MDSLRSIIESHGGDWKGKRVSIQLLGDLTIVCSVDGVVDDAEVATERSIVTVERSGDDSQPNYDPSIVSLPPEATSKILKILFESYRRIKSSAVENTEKGKKQSKKADS